MTNIKCAPTSFTPAGALRLRPAQRCLQRAPQALYVDGNRIRMVTVASADHFFRDLYADDAVDNIDAFLRDIGF